MAVGTAVSIQGQRQSSIATQNAMNYQAQVATNNQKISEENAKYAEAAGSVEERNQRIRTAQGLGTARALLGASGVDVSSGTPETVQSSIAAVGEFDAQTIRANAARVAYGYRVGGVSAGAQAQLDITSGQQAMIAGRTGQYSSLVSGASGVSDKWYKYKTTGVSGNEGT